VFPMNLLDGMKWPKIQSERGRRDCLRRSSRLYLEPLEDRCLLSGDVVLDWNATLLQAIRTASTPPPPASRHMAIVQTAVFDAVNAIDQSYTPYVYHGRGPRGASLEAAAAQAAHDTLVALYPAQQSTFDAELASDLAALANGPAKVQGIQVGQKAAKEILKARANDGSSATVPYTPGSGPGVWVPTPPGFLPSAFPQWPYVTPFAMTSGAQFRASGPPALTSTTYAADFNEVKELGAINSATRTDDQTEIANFWADGPGTETPPGHWNSIAQDVAKARGTTLVQNARLFALLDLAVADAAICAWDSKYVDNFWRPITAIRAANTDGNPDTHQDSTWTPLLVTPNFPGYTSGHSTFSSAGAAVLASFFGTDNISFTTGSDFLPGVTRTFASFSAAAAEAGQSRIYGGIHFQFDNQDALSAGKTLGRYVAQNFLTPRQLPGPAAAAPGPVNQTLSDNQVPAPLVKALARGQGAGVDSSRVSGIDIQIANLGGATLGEMFTHTIWLDANAAGWSWFIDPTSWDDSEFYRPADQGKQNRTDLLNAVMHEMGHVFGLEHDEDGAMPETLAVGTRSALSASLEAHPAWLGTDAVFARIASDDATI
jgi:hypothetical protein